MNSPFEQDLRLIEAGGTILGRFSDVRRINANGGGGQFSLVFSALDEERNRRVALKVFNPQRADAYRLACFEREASILERLSGNRDIIELVHPRAPFSIQIPMGTGQPYVVNYTFYAMELGRSSLAAAIASAGWSPEDILTAFRAICRAVQRIHQQDIAHRDLKPENFLVLPDGKVKLSDFGSARWFDPSIPALSPGYIGPPGDLTYVAPEMLALLHDEVPAIAYWADVYALGAILFELFAGTKLGLHILDRQYQFQLMGWMRNVKAGQRRDLYDQFVRDIAARYPLPGIAEFGTPIPSCIREQLDQLYRSMAALDYRERLRTFGVGFDRFTPMAKRLARLTKPSFASIFRQVDMCLTILRHRQVYERVRMRRQRRRTTTLASQENNDD